MARKSITQSKEDALLFLNDVGSTKDQFTAPSFDAIAKALVDIGNLYAEKMKENFNAVDSVSGGQGIDSIKPLDVQILGNVYSIDIEAAAYLSFVDAGVNGWAMDRNAPYTFKTHGVLLNSPMVQSVKAYLLREGKMGTDRSKRPISQKERTRQTLTTNPTDRQAMSMAFMIKRMGIKPRLAIQKTATDMEQLISDNFSAALRIDIINNILP